jgi:hypothetical protein
LRVSDLPRSRVSCWKRAGSPVWLRGGDTDAEGVRENESSGCCGSADPVQDDEFISQKAFIN